MQIGIVGLGRMGAGIARRLAQAGMTVLCYDQANDARAALPFALKAFALVPADREALNQRIAERFDAMLASGLVDEVRRLRSRYRLTPGMPSMRAVGYRQVWQYLEGEISEAQLREQAVAATRQLAKRQLTWLRSFRELEPAEKLAHSFL